MKKMSKASGNIVVTEAVSTSNGILFQVAKRIDDSTEVGRGNFFTKRDENGTIVTQEGISDLEYFRNKLRPSTKLKVIISIVLYVLMMTSIIFFPISRSIEVLTGLYLIIMGLFFMIEQLEIFTLATLGNEKYQKFRRYHAAEHAVVNAFYDLHRVPTMSEIKKYSNWSYSCGSLEKQNMALPYLTVGICRTLIPGFISLPITLFIAIIVFYLAKKEKIMFLQFLVTSNPQEEEYEVAIEGLLNSINMLEEINEEEAREKAERIKIVQAIMFDLMNQLENEEE